jgi:MFS family permease
MNTKNFEYKLSRDQRNAVVLLSVGRFLESFDFSLYLHMSVVLNLLFFPPTQDPVLQSFITSFGFASSFLVMPFGSLFLGYLGDKFGRSNIIVLTTTTMAFCCLTLAALPTYAQIGISSAIILTVCRMLQSVSVIAEYSGTDIYISEMVKPPVQYPATAYTEVFGALGAIAALGVGAAFTNLKFFSGSAMEYSWRIAFLFGAIVAVVGTIARRSLKDATEFADRAKLIKKNCDKVNIKLNLDIKGLYSQKPLRTYFAYFCLHCAKPVSMYFVYFYCGNLLAENFAFTPGKVISNNLLVAIADFFGIFCLAQLSYKIPPLKLLKFKTLACLSIVVFFPTAMHLYKSPGLVLFFQCFCVAFAFDQVPATPIFYKYFPPFRRFTYSAFIVSCSKGLVYAILPIASALLTKALGHWGMLLLLLPAGICFLFSISFFERREEEASESFAEARI